MLTNYLHSYLQVQHTAEILMWIYKCEDHYSNIYIKLCILTLLAEDACVFVMLSQGITSTFPFTGISSFSQALLLTSKSLDVVSGVVKTLVLVLEYDFQRQLKPELWTLWLYLAVEDSKGSFGEMYFTQSGIVQTVWDPIAEFI